MKVLKLLTLALALTGGLGQSIPPSTAQAEPPLRLEVTDGIIEPLPFAVPSFQAENSAAAEMAQNIARVVAADLAGTGLFREVPSSAFISNVTSFNSPVQYADWRAINVQALITGGAVSQAGGARSR